MIPSLVLGSGAWIWTMDLWVMIPNGSKLSRENHSRGLPCPAT